MPGADFERWSGYLVGTMMQKQWWWTALALGALVAGGCSDDPGELTPDAGETTDPDADHDEDGEADLSITPVQRDYGTVAQGDESSPTDFVVTNDGDGDSGDVAITLGGDSFALDSDDCTDASLAPGGSCTVAVVFQPTDFGDHSGDLTATADPGGSAAATLEGEGGAPGELSIAPTPHDFGGVVSDETSAEQTFVVENTGDLETGEIGVTIGGAEPTQFSVVTDTCDGETLEADGSCDVVAVFEPSSAGAKTASLDVSASPGGSASAVLEGDGLAPASLSIDPTDRNFGSIVTGSESAPTTFTVTNDGDVASSEISVAIDDDDLSQFNVVSDDCGGDPLDASASCEVEVAFAPTETGEKNAILDVSATEGGSDDSFLTGEGIAEGELAVQTGADDFDDTVVDETSASQTVVIENDGDSATGELSTELVGSNPNDFDIVDGGDQCAGDELDGGETCAVEVVFAPEAAGGRSASLEVTAEPGGSVSVSLNGTGLDDAELEFDASSRFFGSVATNDNQDESFTLENAGARESGELDLSIVGDDDEDFNIHATDCGTSLAGGQTCEVTVRFAPGSTGTKTATLEAEAEPGGLTTVSLEGDAIEPGALVFDDASLDFGEVVEGETEAASMVVRNEGEEETTAISTEIVGGGAPAFTILDDDCVGETLGEDETCSVEVEFGAAEAGSFEADLEVSADVGGTIFGALTGTALARIEIDPADHDYGEHKPGNTATKTFSVANRADQRTLATDLADNTRDFAIVNDSCDGVTVGAGGGCSVQVQFEAPDDLDEVDPAVLEVFSQDDDAAASAGLEGSVLGPIEIDPAPHDYGNVVTGEDATQTFTVENDGANEVGPITTELDTADDFAVTSDECVGQPIDPGADCEIDVKFYPLREGTHVGALIVRDDTTDDEFVAEIEGRGAEAANLVIAPTAFDYGEVIVTRSEGTTFTVTNDGEVAADPLEASFGDGEQFEIDRDECDGLALGAGASCDIDVSFAPPLGTELGAKQDELTVSGTDASVTAKLEGDAQSQLDIEPRSADFGDTEVGLSKVETFTVKNEGLETANGISSSLGDGDIDQFVIPSAQNNCADLAAGATCTLDVRFQPSDDKNFEVTLTSEANPGAIAVAEPITGEGLKPAKIDVDPATLAFGGVRQDSVSTSDQFLTYSNVGQVATNELVTTVDGDEGEFSIIEDGCEATTLDPKGDPDESCTIQVRFTPQSGQPAGDRLARITVEESGGDAEDTARVTGEALERNSALVSTPEFADFDAVVEGQESDPVEFAIANTTDATSDELEVSLEGDDDDYSIVSNSDTCTGQQLGAGDTCEVKVEFTPSLGGRGQLLADLVVSDGDPGTIASDAVASLSGIRDAEAELRLEGDGAFGPVAVGDSDEREFTVENRGDEATGSITRTIGGAGFVFFGGCQGEVLEGGESCSFDVRFSPDEEGAHSGTLTVSADPGGEETADLSGDGVDDAQLAISPDIEVCGTEVPAGIEAEVHECSYSVTNEGVLTTGPIDVALGNDANFELSGGDCAGNTLDDGENCAVDVAYKPEDVSAHESSVTVSASPGGSASAEASGTSVSALSGPEEVEISAEVGDSSNARVIAVTNAESTPATDPLTVTLAGADAHRFGITSDDCSGVSLPGEGSSTDRTCSISVRFVPESDRVHDAELVFTDDDPADPNKTATVELRGVTIE